MKKMKIFISGEEGLIGSELVRQLSALKYIEIVNSRKEFDKYRTFRRDVTLGYFSNAKKEIDIRNFKLYDVFKKMKVDMIIHCAAYVNTAKCDADLEGAIDTNVKGTYNLVRIAKEFDIRFVNFSTTATFDVTAYDGVNKLMDENTRRRPFTHYGKTKLLAEIVVKQNLTKYINFLPVFVYGTFPRDNSSELVKIIYATMKNKKDITVNLSLNNLKSYFYVEDAVRAMINIIFNEKAWKLENRDFVIATTEVKHYIDYMQIVVRKLDVNDVNANFISHKDYLQNHIADNSKMLKYSKRWKQKIFINRGIDLIIKSIK